MSYKFISSIVEFKRQCDEISVEFPFSEDISIIGSEVKIGSSTLPNRIVYQAMEGCDAAEDMAPGDLTVRRYNRFAKGGAGLIWVEATAVCKEGRANPRQLYLTEYNKGAFKSLVDGIRQLAASSTGIMPVLILQLTHSGRYSKPNGVSAPLIARHNDLFERDNPIADENIVTDEYLDNLQDMYVQSAMLAEQCGFDGVDIKSCHGYLLSELLSGYNREGKYGGSFENRTRMLVETISKVKAATHNDFIVTSRLSAYDALEYPYGFGVMKNCRLQPDYAEAVMLINKLNDIGVDLIDITMGNPYFNPHVNRPYLTGGYSPPEHPLMGVYRMLEGIREIKSRINSGVKVVSSGITYLGAVAPQVNAGYIKAGVDLIGFGRMTLAYPNVAIDIINNQYNVKKLCLCCSCCSKIMRSGNTPGCVLRDEVYGELYKKLISQGAVV